MAFTDYAISSPVITETDYERVRVHVGEGAYTDTFNRGIVDSINRDAALETALKYIARSTSLYTTPNTIFYVPCDNNGIDVVSGSSCTLNIGSPADMFIADDEFDYAAWPFSATTNILVNTGIDSTLRSNAGWNIIRNDADLGALVVFDATSGLIVSTNSRHGDAPKPGPDGYEVHVRSIERQISDLNFRNEAQKSISASVHIKTYEDMRECETEVIFAMRLKDQYGQSLGSYNSRSLKYKNSYDGIIKLENIAIPDEAVSFSLEVRVVFNNGVAKQCFYITDVMCQVGTVVLPYTKAARSSIYASYNNITELKQNKPKRLTLTAWCKFGTYTVSNAASEVGPLFIETSNRSIGIVHPYADRTKFTLRAYYTYNGQKFYGDTVELPKEALDKYILVAIRLRPNDDPSVYLDTDVNTRYIIEVAAVYEDKVYTSTLPIEYCPFISTFYDKLSVVLGVDKSSSDTMYRTDFFDNAITQIRMDDEWINNLELYVLSLSHKNGRYVNKDVETRVEELAPTSTNLLSNPTGHAGFRYWSVWLKISATQYNKYADPSNADLPTKATMSDYCNTGYDVLFNDQFAGDCFMYSGEATYDELLVSDPIAVSRDTLYSISLKFVDYANSTSYERGIRVNWYKTVDGVETLIEQGSRVMPLPYTGFINTYSESLTSPEDALYARIVLYVKAGSKVSKTIWKDIKFEQGDVTAYTDDTSHNTAYRTSYHITERDLEEIFGFSLDESWSDQRITWGTLNAKWTPTGLAYNK